MWICTGTVLLHFPTIFYHERNSCFPTTCFSSFSTFFREALSHFSCWIPPPPPPTWNRESRPFTRTCLGAVHFDTLLLCVTTEMCHFGLNGFVPTFSPCGRSWMCDEIWPKEQIHRQRRNGSTCWAKWRLQLQWMWSEDFTLKNVFFKNPIFNWST